MSQSIYGYCAPHLRASFPLVQNFTFFLHDIIFPFFAEVDQIYHLACPASPPHYQFNPIKTIKCR